MPDDNQISALVEIARSAAASALSEQQKKEIEGLIQSGLVERTGSGKFKLTPAGQEVLDDRGVGANEA